jgi:hypothetical protein
MSDKIMILYNACFNIFVDILVAVGSRLTMPDLDTHLSSCIENIILCGEIFGTRQLRRAINTQEEDGSGPA